MTELDGDCPPDRKFVLLSCEILHMDRPAFHDGSAGHPAPSDWPVDEVDRLMGP